MPRNIQEDNEDFKEVITGVVKNKLKQAVTNGSIFRSRKPIGITIPRVPVPSFVFSDEVHDIYQIPKKEKKKYRSIDDEWEA